MELLLLVPDPPDSIRGRKEEKAPSHEVIPRPVRDEERALNGDEMLLDDD